MFKPGEVHIQVFPKTLVKLSEDIHVLHLTNPSMLSKTQTHHVVVLQGDGQSTTFEHCPEDVCHGLGERVIYYIKLLTQYYWLGVDKDVYIQYTLGAKLKGPISMLLGLFKIDNALHYLLVSFGGT